MLYLMTNHINIIIIILLTIKIISLKSKQPMANNRFKDSVELGNGNFTAIEFLKELGHFKPTYDSILIMQNQNTTISNVFYTHLIKVLNRENNNGTASTNIQYSFSALREIATTTFVNSIMNSLQVPVLQLNEFQSFYLKRQYCEHLLSIVYIDINIAGIQMTLNDHKGLLEKLSRNLLHMTTSKVMFLLNFPLDIRADGDAAAVAAARIDEDVFQGILVRLFQHCWQQKIINVVALLADYHVTRKFYSYSNFPEFEFEEKNISSNPKEIFPYRLRNLKGYKLPIVIGGTAPRIIPYKTSDGKEIVGGFVGHFIRAFAKKYNCVLIQTLPFNPKVPAPSRDLINTVRNGTAEISAAVVTPELHFTGYTYPLQLANWCIMIPVEANIPGYKFFTLVFKGETYLLFITVIIVLSMVLSAAQYVHGYNADFFNIFCHDVCLRGILCQSFSGIIHPPIIIRFLYIEICALGILLTTSYSSYFSTYVTHPPKETFLNSFDDILGSGLKVVVWEREYKNFCHILEYQKYGNLFHLVKDFHEFLHLRDSFNTKYGYLLHNTKWDIVKEQQKLFTTPLFRQSKNFCFITNVPMCFPVHENSIFNSMINQLILETAQSGLLFKWIDFGFYELIAARKLILEDLSAIEQFQAMTVSDLKYVLLILGGMFVFVNLVFLAELLIFHRKRILNVFDKLCHCFIEKS